MSANKTDKKLLVQGVKMLIFSLLSVFLGPILMSKALADKDNSLYWPTLIMGILISAFAVFLIFKGLRIIRDGIFGKK